ncbi:tail fiber assembly protein [Kluyvera sp. EC_51]|uniref:tail fiber assembly protein n=1 Tax=Kluyvera sp. EC_51 TaxID=2584089 RepID=UPI001C707D0C|nr:tail fiber assembly protein [Kluyvera sp. EC_51]
MKTIYVSELNNSSWATTPAAFGGMTYPVIVDDDFIGGGITYDRETAKWSELVILPRTQDDEIADAERKRAELKQDAEQIMSEWKLDLALGLISEEDKQKLIAWRLYVKELDALELDAAPEIEWPPRPEN